jgi:hypothetical protein
MSFNFPNNPANGQIYAPVDGPVYVWQDGAWQASGDGDDVAAAGSYDTVAVLTAANVPANIKCVTTLGYYAAGDGGGTTYVRNAAAAVYQTSADGAKWQVENRTVFNVRQYGAKGNGGVGGTDQAAVDIALAEALANKGVLYFPRVTAFDVANGQAGYKASIAVNNHKGLTIRGDGIFRTTLQSPTAGVPTINLTGTNSGDTGDIRIEYIHISGVAPTTPALVVNNVINYTLKSIRTFVGAVIEGSQGGANDNCWFYGGNFISNLPALRYGQDGPITGTGPTLFTGGQMSIQVLIGDGSVPVLEIVGNPQNTTFHNVMFSGIANTIVSINGRTGQATAYGGVTFIDCHTESCHNPSNTTTQVEIGKVSKFGDVIFIGGNWFGHGNAINYCAQWMKIWPLGARMVKVDGCMFSKLTYANGFNTAVIRLETGWPAAGDQYQFSNLDVRDAIPVYSDANGVLTAYSGNDTTAQNSRTQVFTVTGTCIKPPWAVAAQVTLINGGTGGGSGRRGAAGSVRCGGGGGASGVVNTAIIPASIIGASTTVTVGIGGLGGAAITADNTDGNPGINTGASSSFGSLLIGMNSTGGGGGTATAGAAGAGGTGTSNGNNGAAASTTGLVGVGGSFSGTAGGSGGSGGGLTTGNAESAGGAGGQNGRQGQTVTAGSAGSAGGGTGGNGGSVVANNPYGGSGGGGGGSSAAGAGGAGGNGGSYGAGGGGGGASVNGQASGKGGDGGPGLVIVTWL